MSQERPRITTAQQARAELPADLTRPSWLERVHSLPFHQLSSDEFEILCFLLLYSEKPQGKVIYYGKTGDLGRDIVLTASDGKTCLVQCKRYTRNVGVEEVRRELAKLATNVHRGRIVKPDEVAWYIVPDLTSPAATLLENQDEWKATAAQALKSHLGEEPPAELLSFARDWWPRFDRQSALSLTQRLKRHSDLVEEFFAIQKVVTGSRDDVAAKVVAEIRPLLDHFTLGLGPVIRSGSGFGVGDQAIEPESIRGLLGDASSALMRWPQTLHNGAWMERDELIALENRFQERSESATVILGPPGSGKSALLARLATTLRDQGKTVFALKADTLPSRIDSEALLSEHLRLPALLSECIKRMAADRPVYVLVDQLDALGDLLVNKPERLSVLLELIYRLSGIPQVHLVMSCREFEFKHDARLNSIDGEPLWLQLPSWEQVAAVLKKHGVNVEQLPERCQELLRSPHNLKLYLDRPQHRDKPFTFGSLQDLLDDLWDRLLLGRNDATARLELVSDIADRMAHEEELWLPVASIQRHRPLLNQLISDGLLQHGANDRQIGFRHQTYFEHARARHFAAGPDQLSLYVQARQNNLFLRPILWSTLHYLRATSSSGYQRAVSRLADAELRPHLQFLLIDFLGQCEQPTDLEQALLQRWLDSSRFQARSLRAIAGNPGWFTRLARTHLPVWMTDDSLDPWPVLNFLVQGIKSNRAQCLAHVRTSWIPFPERDQLTLAFYRELDTWDEQSVQELCRVLARRNVSDHVPMDIADRIAPTQPELALRVVQVVLDRRLKQCHSQASSQQNSPDGSASFRRDGKSLLDSSGFWDLPKLANAQPGMFLREIWPWFLEIVKQSVQPPHDVVLRYREVYDLAFELDEESLKNRPIMQAIEGAVNALAKIDAETFDKFLGEQEVTDALVVQRLLCRGVCERAAQQADIGIAFLTADSRRLCLGDYRDEMGETRTLLKVLGSVASDQQIRRLETSILAWSGYRDSPPNDDPQTRFLRKKWDREHRLRLLLTLPTERLSSPTRKLINDERVALPDYREHDRQRPAFTFYGGPMSVDQMRRASDSDLLNLFRLVAEDGRWLNRRDIDAECVEREFCELAKQEPSRVARLVCGMPVDRMRDFIAAAVCGIGDNPDYAQIELVNLVIRLEQLGNRSPRFRENAAQALASSANRTDGLDERAIAMLERWLDEWTEFGPGHCDMPLTKKRDLSESLLWSSAGGFTLPRGSFWLIRAITYGYLRRNPPDYDAWIISLDRHLDRPENVYMWHATVNELLYLAHARDRTRAAALLVKLVGQYPDFHDSLSGLRVVAQCRRLLSLQCYAALLDAIRNGSWEQRGQAYGELLALSYLLGEGGQWAVDAVLAVLELLPSDRDSVAIWTGLGHTLARCFADAQSDRGTFLFERLSEKHIEPVAQAVSRVFGRANALPAREDSRRFLRTLAASPLVLKNVEPEWLGDALLEIFAYCPMLVYEVSMAYLKSVGPAMTQGAAAYFAAPDFIDIALRLQRHGGELVELGLTLFERLLEVGITEAEATLLDIDGRFRHPTDSVRRPRRRRTRAEE